jgi:cell division protein ZapA
MKQVEVTIMGQSYLLGCPEGGEAALQSAVAQVDREMCSIRDSGRVKARERIAVLAALNLAYELAERRASNAATAIAGTTAAEPAAPGAPVADPLLAALLHRIDTVLEGDGRLI